MGKGQPEQQQPRISVKDTVYKLQLALLEGIKTQDHLYLAGSIISRSDYNDVVTERTIANLCGYPLCSNALPSECSRPRKGHYRISLKEHKVYDLHETYMYCSSRCVIESKAFAQSLSEERCDVLDFGKVERILRAFGDVGFDKGEVGFGEIGDLGISKLKIEEKVKTGIGDLGISRLKIEEKSETHIGDLGAVGPSNAIEGYVPQKERTSKPLGSKRNKEGSKGKDAKMSSGMDIIFNEMDFMSTIITSDEYSVSKIPPSEGKPDFETKFKESKGKVGLNKNDSVKKSRQSKRGKNKNVKKDDVCNREVPSTSDASQTVLNGSTKEEKEEFIVEKAEQSSEALLRSSLKPSGTKKLNRSVTWADETIDSTGSRNLCEVREMEQIMEYSDAFSSMHKPSVENKVGCSNTWFDEKIDSTKSKNICEVREVQDADVLGSLNLQENEILESAEACAMALSQAAEAVASGESDVSGAVSGAGIIILPRPDGLDEEEPTEDVDMLEPEQAPLWPTKPGIPCSDLFDPEDSWFDAPPEGFSLTLSPFATMWNSLFTWITSSTLAYIYGRDESFHEEFLSVNGREYPPKIVLAGGRSSEIKKTLDESFARALPGVVSELRLPTPISSLEQGMGRMLNTMSFIDAIPAFRMKQWQVIVLLFLEGLSVCRIPALTPHMTNRRMLFYKVLENTQISAEQYELMKDLIIPLGRAPQFSAQSGA
ncbi:PREDICTED: putative RNA polymerase II subunit B1 CTD phosphatase RPAP2 homolog [Prunus mume]|uniref:RNA polymerase II subunit B1 CTD phosphatase RPAP2 homolog n=1 Tax=Prunus mume TaxID=102107 RepID=A0ABM0PXY9_PRUMU|nr:PREDICTED: putative RNA polymerase II subunit B1 CTD phosphatase RPAP2 homolog [Prunus mume]